MVIQTFYLHVVPDVVTPIIYLKQYDANLVQLTFNLVGVNDYYTIPSGTYVTCIGKKPDGKAFSYACTWSGYTVNLVVTEQMTAVAGRVKAELRFQNSSGSSVMSSIGLDIIIKRSAIDGITCSKNDLVSVNEFIIGARSDALAAEEYAAQAKTTYNNTVSAGTTAVNNINSSRTTAVNAINTAKNSAITSIEAAQEVAEVAINEDKETALSSISSSKNSAITQVQATADSISDSAEAVQEGFDQALAQIQSYADDPNKVIYEYTQSSGNFRITALATDVGPVEEPNAVVYDFDDETDTLTFTPAE